jgi:hypothetical protein
MTEWSRDIPPSAEELTRAWIERYLGELHVAMPGRIESYDAATQTANVLPLVRHPSPQPDGSTAMEDLPVIPSVPVLWPRGGGWFFATHLEAGDTVQLLVNSAAIGHWRVGGGDVTDPGDLRRHHLSHAVAIPGLATRAGALRHAPNGPAGLVFGQDADNGTRVRIDRDGTVTVVRDTTELLRVATNGEVTLGGTAGAQFVALANLVDARLSALKTILTGWTVVPGDGGAALKTAMAAWSVASVAATKGKSR